MFSLASIRNACPSCFRASVLASRQHRAECRGIAQLQSLPQHPALPSSRKALGARQFTNSRILRDESAGGGSEQSTEDIEKVVREAKQRFRDTLPKGYLNAEEYRLYERLYGPPLRETTPEDVGLSENTDMGGSRPDGEGILLRELQGSEFEDVAYELTQQEGQGKQSTDSYMIEKEPSYIDLLARNDRERAALEQLQKDFEASAAAPQEASHDLEDLLEEDAFDAAGESESWAAGKYPTEQQRPTGEARRFHPYTLQGRFHDSPVEVLLPKERLVQPLMSLLGRTHLDHVKTAAESSFGGRGLPTSPVTPAGLRNGHMEGIGLPPDSRHMTEIEADAFLAAYIPGAYSSSTAILREVRKRLGSDWIQPRLKDGGPGLSVLDAGAGGAGLVAWEQIVQAEWHLLVEEGEVEGEKIPGKKTVVVGSDRLRGRIKTFLDNTTFLPRLPDYAHSGAMKSGPHLDSGGEPQKRKSYDIIIASHLFLKEEKEHYRQAILNNLWALLNKDGGVLIVVEKAHPRGFEAVAHVRDTVLKQFLLPQSGESTIKPEDFNPAYQRELEAGHIIAPCTNHGPCPMYLEPGKSKGRKDYCHFSQRFVRPGFYSKILGNPSRNQGEVEFSYVAMQRGVQKKGGKEEGRKLTEEAFQGYEHAEERPDPQTLPRVVLPPIKRKGHILMDMCTSEGKLERWTVPKSFSKVAYHDARKSRWGDLWALGAKTRVARNVRAGSGVDTAKKRAIAARKSQREAEREEADEWPTAAGRKGKNSRARRQEDAIRQLMMEAEHEEDGEIDAEVEEELAELDREEEAERHGRR